MQCDFSNIPLGEISCRNSFRDMRKVARPSGFLNASGDRSSLKDLAIFFKLIVRKIFETQNWENFQRHYDKFQKFENFLKIFKFF